MYFDNFPGSTEPPNNVEMDTHNDQNNEYVHEDIWKNLIKWYGISAGHHMDRRHLYFKDEKPFDVCILSPFSGIVEHTVKKFNRYGCQESKNTYYAIIAGYGRFVTAPFIGQNVWKTLIGCF